MTAFGEDCATLLVREVNGLAAELDLFPDDASAWRTPPGLSNSAANLGLHVAGNVQHFIGAVLGGTGYVRNREHEFACREGSREMVKAELARAAEVARSILPNLSPSVMDAPYPLTMFEGKGIRTSFYLHHLCVHAGFHLGQAGYARRVVTGASGSSGPLSLAAIMSPL